MKFQIADIRLQIVKAVGLLVSPVFNLHSEI
jgi:hypothetical protein